ncbi:ThuA domain-containing protein [bacterium]|nr:ThuA domain-containing protein [bacterium]
MKSRALLTLLCGLFVASLFAPAVHADQIKVLALTKSSGFEHSVIRRDKGELGHAEKILVEMGKENGMLVVPTKDGGLIHPAVLDQFDVVFFYTTGELDKPGKKDFSAPMSTEQRASLIEWVKNGGGFVGSHTCADTFHRWVDESGKKPYIEMVGGEFATHGKQEKGYLTVLDHPITSHLNQNEQWAFPDEWYIFKNVNNTFKPLLILETKKMEQEKYTQLEPYPVAGVKDFGKGKVFTCALGHREDVWTNPDFKKLMVKGIQWAAGELK